MNTIGSTASRTLHRIASALFLACVASCGARVNLGDSSQPPAPDPDASPDPAAPPTTLYQFNQNLFACYDIAVDDSYVYLSTGEPGGLSVHRCRKTDCAGTMKRVVGPLCNGCGYEKIVVAGNFLGLMNNASSGPVSVGHIDACTRPDCGDVRQVVGGLPTIGDVAFDDNRFYWHLSPDGSFYQCSFPTCSEGPRVFATGVPALRSFAANADWIYWVNPGVAVSRKRKDGSAPVEDLILGPVLGRVPHGGAGVPPEGLTVGTLAVDGSWIYGLSSRAPDADAGTGCEPSRSPCFVVRWPDAIGGAAEVILHEDTGINFRGLGALRVFQGEVVYSSDQAHTCDADACSATRRAIGQADPDRMASDRDYLYWCSRTMPGMYDTLQRVARVRR